MRFDTHIDDQIQSMDNRLKRLEKMTSQDARSDTKRSNKVIKQVQFSQTRRSSLKDNDQDDVMASLKLKPQNESYDRKNPNRTEKSSNSHSPEPNRHRKSINLGQQSNQSRASSYQKFSPSRGRISTLKSPAVSNLINVQQNASTFASPQNLPNTSPQRLSPRSPNLDGGKKAVKFDLDNVDKQRKA